MKKLRVGVIYGGRSGEHEISLASAAAIFAHLNRERYEPIPIKIEKDGRWTLPDRPPAALSAAEAIEQVRLQAHRSTRSGRDAHLVSYPSEQTLLTTDREHRAVTGLSLDVIFPVLHGPYGEDGTVQGLLELANVPYVGAGVLASAVGMDKAAMKVMFAARGLPICEHIVLLSPQWETRREELVGCIERRLPFPVFVKPANLGSSVGISKARTPQELGAAIDLAATYDRKIIVEEGVADAREIECGVLGNDEPEASVPGEVIPSREFYDYEAKYLGEGSRVVIPAALTPEQSSEVRRLAIEAFRAIDGAGLARVDFLLSRPTGVLYVNEINTLPGFTTISMYSKLWEESGVGYAALLDRLIELALERHAAKQRLRTSLS